MNAKLLAIASALAATAALASAAEAGGGVRLGFGGPLGTFVAPPSHGPAYGGGGSGYRKSMKRKTPVAHAAPKEAETTTEQKEAPVTGSSALIQGSIPAETPPGEAEKPAPEVKAEAPSEPAKTAATEGPEACKRFVPAVGVTVSVDCEQ